MWLRKLASRAVTADDGLGDWAATERAAAAMRRLNQALANRRVDDELLDEITATVEGHGRTAGTGHAAV